MNSTREIPCIWSHCPQTTRCADVRGLCPRRDPICSVTSFRNLQVRVVCPHHPRYGRCRDSQDRGYRTIERTQRRACLFPYAMALALSFGAISVIGVVSNPIARLYRRFGLDLRNIGAGMAPGPADIVACSIDLGPGTFHRLRCDPVMLLDSITRFGQLPLPQAGRPDQASGEAPPIVCGRATVSMRATI